MRDIEQYTKDYLNQSYDFENQMVMFRRKKVLGFLESYNAKNILEIGCGEDSIANYYTHFESFSIVEPSSFFAKKAQDDLSHSKNVSIINDFVENRIELLQNKSFDFIILSSLLHEVINPNAFLQDIVKLCRSHTILHINVPNAHSFHLLWAYKSGLVQNIGELTQNAKRLQQHTTFTLEGLQAMVQHVSSGLSSGGGGGNYCG